MKQIFGSSPRTTIMGYLVAIGTVVVPIIQDETFDIHTQWKTLLVAGCVAVWGRLQKDSNGITASEAKAVIKPDEVNSTNN